MRNLIIQAYDMDTDEEVFCSTLDGLEDTNFVLAQLGESVREYVELPDHPTGDEDLEDDLRNIWGKFSDIEFTLESHTATLTSLTKSSMDTNSTSKVTQVRIDKLNEFIGELEADIISQKRAIEKAVETIGELQTRNYNLQEQINETNDRILRCEQKGGDGDGSTYHYA